jgi:hypothetical protein
MGTFAVHELDVHPALPPSEEQRCPALHEYVLIRLVPAELQYFTVVLDPQNDSFEAQINAAHAPARHVWSLLHGTES